MGWQAEGVCSVILGGRGGSRGGPDLRCEGEHCRGRELLLCPGDTLEKTQTCSALTSAASGWGRITSAPARPGWGFWGGFEEPQLPLSQPGPS